jgi:nucleotide-binding universal stress UspA family protein
LQKGKDFASATKKLFFMLQGTANHGIENILVPTDMSPASAIALQYAVAIAQQMRACVTVYHSFEIAAGFTTEEYNAHMRANIEKLQKELEQQLNLFVEPYANTPYTLGNGTVELKTFVKLGAINKEIATLTDDDSYDLVVMGTKGASGVNEVVFGSVANTVAEVVKCPLLVVPEKAVLTELDRIAYGTNFEAYDTVVIDELIEWAGYFNHAIIDCLHISTNPAQKADKIKKLDQLAKEYEDVPNLRFSLIEDDSITKGLDKYIESNQPDMMAVLRRERTFIEKLFKTSISKNLTFHSKVPVLILKTAKK